MSAQPEAVRHLLTRIRQTGLPEPVTEFQFAPPRRWRFDVAFLSAKVAVEIDGGTWSGGRHVTGKGFEDDCLKKNMAVELGWRVLTYTTGLVLADEAIIQLERVLTADRIREAR
jgi:very-short-patch-repair endonuclease